MKTLRFALVCSLFLLWTHHSCAYIVEGTRVHKPKMLNYINEMLNNTGTIEQTENGVYLQLSEEYLRKLTKMLPDYILPNNAKICIITKNESKKLAHLAESGKKIKFKPLGFFKVVNDEKEYFMLAVDSPELSEIRQKYGLGASLNDEAFNLTLGIKNLNIENELD